jgi:hypothetical protein
MELLDRWKKTFRYTWIREMLVDAEPIAPIGPRRDE